jgi:diadenosine tetraphosphate (Ap4A) HIT family hydrolase
VTTDNVVGCVFCRDNWDNLDVVTRPSVHVRIIRPLNPVCEGHVLAIHALHSTSVADDPHVAGTLMWAAAYYCGFHELQANIITSIGPDATQTVFHAHLHIVPRRPDDGLLLPWSLQHESLQELWDKFRLAQSAPKDKGLWCPTHRAFHPSPVCDPV